MYFLFQTIGAFFGAAVIFGMYYGKDWLQMWSQIWRNDVTTAIYKEQIYVLGFGKTQTKNV